MTHRVWPDVLTDLEPTISRPNFVTWLKSTDLREDGPGLLTVTVPNPYAKNWIEKNVLEQIKQSLAKHFETIDQLRVVVDGSATAPLDDLPILQNTPEPAEEKKEAPIPRPFSSKYTFDSFIVGNNNRLAFAAAEAVAENPGEAYNPLFLYGGVGLGKTHLMQAIGNRILDRSPKKKISYISCETFASEFIEALQNKAINDFKRKYRNVDVFLIDDIQFLANKEGTQEEFFHTFNTLHQSNRQIVMTADRMPKEIASLEDRLVSRIGWGMVADIQAPNFENRVAILQAKAKSIGLVVDSAVLEFVANTITSNVRELEGSLIKLATTAKVEGRPISLAMAAEALKHSARTNQRNWTTKKVIQAVARHFNLSTNDLLGSKRSQEIVYPRQIVMYLCRTVMHQSYPQIGEALGGKDHTTIMHGSDKISELLKHNRQTEEDIRAVTELVEEGS